MIFSCLILSKDGAPLDNIHLTITDSFIDLLAWSPRAGVKFFEYIPWANCVDLDRAVSWASIFLKDWGGFRKELIIREENVEQISLV